MIKKSTVYKVICDNLADKYVLADNFREAEDIVKQYLQNENHDAVIISISKKGDILYDDNRTEC